MPLLVCGMPTDVLILISSNKGVEGDVGDAMVVRTAMVNFTRFKGAIEIKEGPRAVSSFTFQGVVIPGSVEVVVHKRHRGRQSRWELSFILLW